VERVRGLERRDDPLEPRDAQERGQRLLVGHRNVRRPAGVTQPRVLWPGAGVVEPGAHRVRLEDLAVVALQHRGQRAVEHARLAADGERRAVAAGLQPLPRGLDADQRDGLVADEPGEHADRVRPAADARDDAIGQPAGTRQELGAGLVADPPLEVAHDRRIRRGPDRRADDVVRRRDVRDPVADRLADGLLERARARVDRHDRRAEHAHPLHVGLLAADVLGAHVDDALQAEQRARRRRRDAVLAGAGLGDDPLLAHPLGEQRLAERVVDLVRAGVQEVLALEPHLAPGRLAEPLGEVQRRRPADVVAQEPVELALERLVAARLDPRRLELAERGHERLGDVLASVRAVAVLDPRLGLHAVTSAPATASANAATFAGSFTPD
jgi:hypothetical protein